MMKPIRCVVPLVACTAVLVAGGAGLSGCLGTEAQAQVGSEGPNAASFRLTNGLDKSVTSVKVKKSGEDKYGEPLLQSSPISEGETVDFSYTPQSDESDLLVETDDGSTYVLHDLELGDMEDATLMTEGQTAYLDYTSTKLGKEKSTLASEKDLVIAELQADHARQQAKIEKLAAAKRKAEAEKKAESKKRAEAEKKARQGDAAADAKSDSSDAVEVTAGALSASSSGSGSSRTRSSSGSSRKSSSSKGSESGSSKRSSASAKSSSPGSSAAQKAAEANGSSSEQKCTKDF